MYVGILATAVALWFPPLLGGIAIVAPISVLTRTHRSRTAATFRDYDARNPIP